MAVEIRLTKCRNSTTSQTKSFPQNRLVTPGDIITSGSGFMRGHGTYVKNDVLLASVAGVVETVNRLVSVRPLKCRYNGEVGDVIVGRIIEVQQKRWKVDIFGKLDAVLLLSAVNLPGGEQRRRGTEDEIMMRQYLQEGDLISAEVRQVFSDGSLSLHTRSMKYGKLCQGTLIKVSPSLILRRKTHFHNLPCGASVIFGNNGFIWIAPIINEEGRQSTDGLSSSVGLGSGGYVVNLEPVSLPEREAIAMLRNCILALAAHRVMLYDTSVLHAYDLAQKYQVKDLLKPDIMEEVAEKTKYQLELVTATNADTKVNG